MGILSPYPLWFFTVCLLIGLTYSSILYYKNKHKVFSKTYTVILFILRFLSTSAIAFLLMEPTISINKKIYNKAEIAVVFDNSVSILSPYDSTFAKTLPQTVDSWIDKNSNNADFFKYTFGEKFTENGKIDFSENSSNMGQIFDEIKNRYFNRNLRGIVLLSDGIYNSGDNPLNAASKIKVPIYCVALGDTSRKIDLAISSLNGNREVVFNNYFPIELNIVANKAQNLKSTLKIDLNDQNIFSQDIFINNQQFSKLINVKQLANKKGLNKISVSFAPVENEINKTNNYRSFYFNVIDDKKKITIFANSPHPDINAIKSALADNSGYEIDVHTQNFSESQLSNTDLLILHQLPSKQNKIKSICEYSNKASIPTLFIIGSQSSLSDLNSLNAGISVKAKSSQFSDAQCLLNENFQLFTVPNEEKTMLQNMPPLNVPFGDYGIGNGVNVLAYQKIGSIATNQPAIAFSEKQNIQQAVIFGEGIWRWRIYEYQRSRNHQNFNNFIARIVHFLSQNSNRSKFRVIYQHTHSENENVEFFAELLNENHELINDPDVLLSVNNSEGKSFSYTFNKSGAGYALNCGRLKPGKYNFTAKVNSKKYPYSQSGEFTIDNFNPELTDLCANHNMLKLLAENSGGKLVNIDQLDKITEDLNNKGVFEKTYHREIQYQNAIEWKWLLFAIVGLLTFEWIIRKREGYY